METPTEKNKELPITGSLSLLESFSQVILSSNTYFCTSEHTKKASPEIQITALGLTKQTLLQNRWQQHTVTERQHSLAWQKQINLVKR